MTSIFQKYDRIKLLTIAAIVGFLPYYLHISNVLIGVAVGFTILKMVILKEWNFKLNILALLFVAYFVVEAIGLLYTAPENLRTGYRLLERHQAFILLPLIFSDFEIDRPKREFILATFVISCFIGILICLVANMYLGLILYDQYFHEWLFTHERFAEPIGLHAVYFSLFIGMAILIVQQFYFDGLSIFPKIEKKGFSGIEKDSLMFLAVVFFAALVTLGSRTIIVSVVLISISLLLKYALSTHSYKLLAVAAAIPIVLVGLILINPVVKVRFMDLLHTRYEDSNYGSYFARLDIWRPGLEAIKEQPWIGVGTGDHQAELNKKFIDAGFKEGLRLEFNVHNQYLNTWLCNGLIGLFIFLSILGVQLLQAIRNKDWYYLGFLGLFMMACMTESTLIRIKGVLFFASFSFVFFRSKNHQRIN